MVCLSVVLYTFGLPAFVLALDEGLFHAASERCGDKEEYVTSAASLYTLPARMIRLDTLPRLIHKALQ
jgi:hypothetical protein